MNNIHHDNGIGDPPIGAESCGCDDITPRIHQWETGEVVVGATYCANCGRTIALRIDSAYDIIGREITPEAQR